MKRFEIIAIGVLLVGAWVTSCTTKTDPGLIYMPDMTYSRAYEAYAERDTTEFTTDELNKGGNKIYYDAKPVVGTVKRGELFAYKIANDSNGYKMSASVQNPISDSMASAVGRMEEAGRLYNINCAICHGATGGGNGPLSTGGKVGGVANLILPDYVAMADGTMYHTIQYGKGVMGSYASQLSREQRWMIVKYIRKLQKGDAPANGGTDAAGTDSVAVAKK